jgi:hypothetical protein
LGYRNLLDKKSKYYKALETFFVFSGSRNYRKNSESELSLNCDARSPEYFPVTKSIENCPSSPEYIPVTENLGTIHILHKHFYCTKLNLTN